MPRKKKGAVYLTVELPTDVYALASRAAAIKGVTVAKFVQGVITAIYLENVSALTASSGATLAPAGARVVPDTNIWGDD